jgi:hypothetical protein
VRIDLRAFWVLIMAELSAIIEKEVCDKDNFKNLSNYPQHKENTRRQ